MINSNEDPAKKLKSSFVQKSLPHKMKAFPIAFVCLLLIALSAAANDAEQVGQQIYLDVKPANTSMHLESIRMLPLSTYNLLYESKRTRVGVTGPNVAAVIPDAVDVVPKRILPPTEKGGKPIILENVPSVNEHTLFMYSVGATQELARMIDELESRSEEQTREIASIYGDVAQLEEIISSSSDGNAELRMREAEAKAEISKNEMEMTIQKAKDEEEYAEALRKSEEEQLVKIETLTFERLKREDEAARIRTEQSLRAKIEASQRIERTRSEAAEAVASVEHEQKLVLQRAAEEMKVKTAKSVAIAKAKAERANEDIRIRRLHAEYEQRRKRNVAAINAVFSHLATSLSTAVKNPREVITFIGYACLMAFAVFAAKETSRLIRSIIEATLGKPQLIRETTRKQLLWSLFTYIAQLVSCLTPWLNNSRCGSSLVDESFDDLILPEELKERVLSLAHSAKNAHRHNAPFRHVLLYGPPGTGKTFVAKKLAKIIGIDYAMMSGGDVCPLGSDAVTQIHQLFAWAAKSPKGVVLFIDEAECFLGSRGSGLMSDVAHNALNALLYNTGGERKDFMLVLATNRADDLDVAILDRCDESLFFPLPNAECRKDLIELYYDIHCRQFITTNNQQALSLRSRLMQYTRNEKPFFMSAECDLMTGEQLTSIVSATYGFSGREIGKLMVALQGAIYVSKDGTLDFATAWKLVETKVREHHEKLEMVGKLPSTLPQDKQLD